MKKGLNFGDLDWVLLAVALAIAAVGVVEIYSTTMHTALAGQYRRQIDWVFAGTVLALVASQMDYHIILDQSIVLYIIGLLGLGALLVIGHPVGGVRRWIEVGGLTFQVSEMMKLIIIICVAAYFAGRRAKAVTWKDLLALAIMVALPGYLVAREPDLGTALTLLPAVIAGIFFAGIRIRQLVIVGVAALCLLPVGWHMMRPYQRERIMTFVHPSHDTRGSSYQVTQSKIAIGSGGLWGKGVGNGTQSRLGFIPVSHADFIFAAFAEEQGFAGALVVLVLYAFLLVRLLDGAQLAPDRAGAIFVIGLVSVLFFQVAVNVGMMIGLLPITGIPLPLMSQGGSSVLFTFIGLGLALSVRARRFVN
ncbi:MAG: rod shape-determining protein RodA [Acidobacteriota bacterium]|nr:rod shape-determining protein RodA [Acidobacteriota bacterium]